MRHRGRSSVVVMAVLSHVTHGRLVNFRHLVKTENVPAKGTPDTQAIRQAIEQSQVLPLSRGVFGLVAKTRHIESIPGSAVCASSRVAAKDASPTFGGRSLCDAMHSASLIVGCDDARHQRSTTGVQRSRARRTTQQWTTLVRADARRPRQNIIASVILQLAPAKGFQPP